MPHLQPCQVEQLVEHNLDGPGTPQIIPPSFA